MKLKNLLPLFLLFCGGFAATDSYAQWCPATTSSPATAGCSLNFNVSFSTTGGVTNITNLNTNCAAPIGAGGYIFYSTMPHTGIQGTVVNYSFTNNVVYQENYGLWVDWNQDFDFDDPGEMVYGITNVASGATITGSFTIPLTAVPGTTRMRLRTFYAAGLTPCNPTINPVYDGETEDYPFVVVAAVPCSGTPVGGTAVAANPTPCAGNTTMLGLTGSSASGGLTYQWEEELPIGSATWVNVTGGTGATTPSYLTAPVTVAHKYRAKVTCTTGTAPTFAYSAPATVTPFFVNLPYQETFESITASNQLPNCMTGTAMGTSTRTYISTLTGNQTNHTPGGSKFANFYYYPASTSAFITPGITLQGGKTYLFTYWVVGYANNSIPFTSLGTFYGTAPTVAGLTNFVGSVVPNNTTYQQVSQTFTPTTTDVYFIGIVATSTGLTSSPYNYYVSVDDLGLKELTPCAGKPVAGAVAPVSPCAGQNFTMYCTGGTSDTAYGGLTFQWQDSTATGWMPSTGPTATQSSYTTSITAATTFRMIVTCTASGLSDTSAAYRVLPASFLNCYCSSVPVYNSLVDLGNVTIANASTGGIVLNNGTGTPLYSNPTAINSYSNFTSLPPATLYRDTTYKISLSEILTGTYFYTSIGYAYIDYNQNGIFENSELIINQTTSSATTPPGVVTQNFTVPSGAKRGVTAMRVIMAYPTVTPDPCVAYSYGETEDYRIKIDYAPCNGPVNPGRISASDTAVCVGYAIDLYDTTHEYERSMITWSWQSSNDGGLSWNPVPGSVNKDTLLNVMVTGATYFRVKMVCDGSGDSTFSAPAKISIKAPYACYCYSQSNGGKTDSSDIGAVVIGNMVNATSGPHTDNPSAIRRRTDYTGIPNIVLNANGTYRLSVYHIQRNHTHADARVSVFMDFNNDLQYQVDALPNSERIYTDITTAGNFYLDTFITIPSAVIPNVPTGMRVIINNDLNPFSPANMGCGPYVSGETEDYVVMFRRAPQGVGGVQSLEQISLYPNPTSGRFRISASAKSYMADVEVVVTTMTGQTVLSKTYNNIGMKFNDELDLSETAKGIYFVTFKTGTGDKMVQKLIVK